MNKTSSLIKTTKPPEILELKNTITEEFNHFKSRLDHSEESVS